MVKSCLSIIITFLVFIGGAIYEQTYIRKAFDVLNEEFFAVYKKLSDETATEEDLSKAQNKWLEEKYKLHAFIPHNEIKELDLWIAEAVYYAKEKDYDEAKGKVSVTLEHLEQIPKTFALSFENLF